VSKDNQENLLKWSIKGRIKAKMFSFDQLFQAYEKDKFAYDFFNSTEVVNNIEVVSNSGKSNILGEKAKRVKVNQVTCSTLSMDFFDKLFEGVIAKESGDINKCFDDFIQGFSISDNLRQMLMNEDSDVYCEFNETEREEFLFLLFSHICLGGEHCQYEDNVKPYLNMSKSLYKDLISVQKDPETKELSILSHVFKVSCYDDQDDMFFPAKKLHKQNFAYLIIDPLKRTVICLSHVYGYSPDLMDS